MVDNQHKLIKGYRDLSVDEIALMNEGKELAAKVGEWVERCQLACPKRGQDASAGAPVLDPRWLAIGKTHLQQGFMAAIRAIARPESF